MRRPTRPAIPWRGCNRLPAFNPIRRRALKCSRPSRHSAVAAHGTDAARAPGLGSAPVGACSCPGHPTRNLLHPGGLVPVTRQGDPALCLADVVQTFAFRRTVGACHTTDQRHETVTTDYVQRMVAIRTIVPVPLILQPYAGPDALLKVNVA